MSHLANDTYAEHMKEVGEQALFQHDVEMVKRVAKSLTSNGYKQQATDLLEDMMQSDWYCDMCENKGKVEITIAPDDSITKDCPYCTNEK